MRGGRTNLSEKGRRGLLSTLYNPFRMDGTRGAWPEEGLHDSESESESDNANPNEGDNAAPSAGTDAGAGPSGTTVAEVETTSPSPAVPDGGFSQDENPQDVEFFNTSELPPDTSTWWLSEDATHSCSLSPRAGWRRETTM